MLVFTCFLHLRDDDQYKPYLSYLWIQSSDGLSDGLEIPLVDATSKGLGLGNIDVTSEKKATEAIDLTNVALQRESYYRSSFGARQNRLEHSINNNENAAENTTASESLIRDTDMNSEMVKFTTHSILEQSGQSMLAQANMSREYILSLLK